MKCPNCSSDVAVFSAQWQSQRDSAAKKCPSCNTEVEAVFGARAFITWFVLAGFTVAGILLVFGASPPAAISYAATSGFMLALLCSLQLRTPIQATAVRSILNRPINLPQRFHPPPWFITISHVTWALASVLLTIFAVSIGLPTPWSGLLLACFGLLGIWRREVHLSWFKLVGKSALTYAVALLVVGVGLLARHYIYTNVG